MLDKYFWLFYIDFSTFNFGFYEFEWLSLQNELRKESLFQPKNF